MSKSMVKIKNISKKRIAFISIFLVLLSAVLIVGGYISVCLIKTDYIDLKTDAQVYADADVLNADVSYLIKDRHIFQRISRLGYRKDGSIKVVLKESLQDWQKQIIKNTYENIINPLFDIINDKYVFEVVDVENFTKTAKDTVVIYFEHDKELDNYWGADAQTHFHPIKQHINSIFDTITIKLSKTSGETAVLHEILHTFGLDDVVNQENYSTFLKYNAEHILLYKPNDIKALAALYYQGRDFYGLNKWIEDYTKNYYIKLAEHYSVEVFYDYILIEDGDLDDDIIISNYTNCINIDTLNFVWTQPVEVEVIAIEAFEGKRTFGGGNDIFMLDFEITLDNGLFEFVQKDRAGNVLYTASGEYYHYSGKIFLGVLHTPIQGVTVKHDVVIMNTENGFRLCSIKESFNNFFYSHDIDNMKFEKLFLTEI